MLTIDTLFENLDITVHPFLLCCAEDEVTLSLGPRDEATIHYVLGGRGTLSFEGYPAMEVEAGAMIVAPPDSKHRLKGTGDPRQMSAILRQCQPLNSGLDELGTPVQKLADGIAVACGTVDVFYRGMEGIFNYLPEPIMVQSHDGDIIWQSFEMIIREMTRSQAGSRAMLRSLFQGCLIEMLRLYSTDETCQLQWLQALNKPRLNKVIESIIEDPAKPYTLESLAEQCAMSRSTFAAKFKEAFGRSAMDFVKEVRLRTAAKMLIQTDIPVKNICLKVGYDSRSHFTHAFSELFDSSPGQYREAHSAR
ncbi:MAG: AraC-like DNA-binding protein [Gammaproteobacteria bacterium]|jgi:AraC-like DNA-binding protein